MQQKNVSCLCNQSQLAVAKSARKNESNVRNMLDTACNIDKTFTHEHKNLQQTPQIRRGMAPLCLHNLVRVKLT